MGALVMKQKIFQIMSRIMDVPVEQLTKESSPDTVEKWDSIQHMSLVLALEEEFNIIFSDSEIVELLSIELIIEIVSLKLASQ
ncbi:MAG: acyl carrier protein [Deltaproteobacteria bacterium]|nr:acyl carrier protein [Deltaproteobacteria bacterium]